MAFLYHFQINFSVLSAGIGHLVLKVRAADNQSTSAPGFFCIGDDRLQSADGCSLVKIGKAVANLANLASTLGVIGRKLYHNEVIVRVGFDGVVISQTIDVRA